MTYSAEKLDAELIRDERLVVGKVYRCTAGKLTAGVGRNLDDNPLSPALCAQLGVTNAQVRVHGLTREQAIEVLHADIAECEADLDRNLPWWRTLSDARQRVLLNMCFNLGIKRLLSFRNTLGFMKAGDYDRAANGMLASLWAKQVKGRADRLAMMMRGKLA